MSDRVPGYLEKAAESFAGATSELANRRYNNCANRAYYACFQAAVHALLEAGIRPPKGAKHWGHDFVRARFNGDLINRRKLYPADVGGALEQNFRLRATADYSMDRVPELQAARAVRRAEAFVAAVAQAGGRRQSEMTTNFGSRAWMSGRVRPSTNCSGRSWRAIRRPPSRLFPAPKNPKAFG